MREVLHWLKQSGDCRFQWADHPEVINPFLKPEWTEILVSASIWDYEHFLGTAPSLEAMKY